MKIQLLWVTVVLSYAAAPCSLRAGTDPDAIYGTWVAVAGEAFGHKMPEGEAGGIRITFTAKKAIWQFWTAEGNKSYEGFCRINASAIPNEIDLGQPDNPRPKSLGLGIYKIEDDKLTIWMTLMERPKDFSDVAAAKLELRREKSASGGVTDDPVAAKELTKLQGTWYHVSRVVDGKEVEGEDKEALLIVRRNLVVVKRSTNEAVQVGQVATVKIVDARSEPKALDLLITDGPAEGWTILAIYQLDRDTFKYWGSYSARPKDFSTKKGKGEEGVLINTYKRKRVVFEIRAAAEQPGNGFKELPVRSRDTKLFVAPEASLTAKDVADAATEELDGKYSIRLILTKEGADKFRRLTREHISKPLAIMVDGEVVSAPIIRAELAEHAMISGQFTRDEVEMIVGSLKPAK